MVITNRERVGNALVHRDYAIEGAKCQLVVTPDAVTVKPPIQRTVVDGATVPIYYESRLAKLEADNSARQLMLGVGLHREIDRCSQI